MLFVVAQDAIVVGAAWVFSVIRYRAGFARARLRSRFAVVFRGRGLWAQRRAVAVVIRSACGIRFGGDRARMCRSNHSRCCNQLDLRGAGFVVSFVGIAVIAPVAEEIFFRGFLYGGLRSRIGRRGGP